MKSFRKYLLYLSFAVFVTGAFLKFFRTPFHTIIMVVGAGGLLIASILYLTSKNKDLSLITLGGFFTTSLYVSIVKFLPSMIPGIGMTITLLLVVFVLLKTRKFYVVHHLMLSFILVITLLLGAMPKDSRYHLLNIKFNNHIDKDYWAWDKYSWFLYNSGKLDEAIIANKKAFEMVQNADDSTMKDLIKYHRQHLTEDNWKKFKM